MKLLFAFLLLVSSSFSFASDSDVLKAIVHDIRTSNIDCNWSNILNTMSNFEAQYKVTSYLQTNTEIEIQSNIINTTSTWAGGLKRMSTKVVLNSSLTRVARFDFVMETFKKSVINTGTILNPSYQDQYTGRIDFAASCIVR